MPAEDFGSAIKAESELFGQMSILSFKWEQNYTTLGGGALVCSTLEQKIKQFFFLLKPEKCLLIISILKLVILQNE